MCIRVLLHQYTEEMPMFFDIDPTGDVPMYEQIGRQVKLAVTNGVLIEGQMLPSVRHLSKELAINPNTIARAYQDLQDDRVLEAVRGRGMIVSKDAVKHCTKARNSMVGDGVRQALANALAGGMTIEELRGLFEAELQAQSSPSTRQRKSKRKRHTS